MTIDRTAFRVRISAPMMVEPPRPPEIEVPPPTAAGTEGSTSGSASDSDGALIRPM